MEKVKSSSIVVVGIGCYLLMALYGIGLTFVGETPSDRKFGIFLR